MITKYGFEVQDNLIQIDLNRLVNQIWKMLPMYENGEDWREQLHTVLLEIVGLHSVFEDNENYLIVLTKLEGINNMVGLTFEHFRKTVFETISLIKGAL